MDVPPAAFVYVPPGTADYALYAQEGVTHIERRGYRQAGVLLDWSQVEQILAEGAATVVVFARRTHSSAEWASTGLRTEFVGEETRRLAVPTQARAVSRRTTPGSLANEVAAYRSGYADGYVDSATLRSAIRRQSGPG
jgi:hypothetical protein